MSTKESCYICEQDPTRTASQADHYVHVRVNPDVKNTIRIEVVEKEHAEYGLCDRCWSAASKPPKSKRVNQEPIA